MRNLGWDEPLRNGDGGGGGGGGYSLEQGWFVVSVLRSPYLVPCACSCAWPLVPSTVSLRIASNELLPVSTCNTRDLLSRSLVLGTTSVPPIQAWMVAH